MVGEMQVDGGENPHRQALAFVFVPTKVWPNGDDGIRIFPKSLKPMQYKNQS